MEAERPLDISQQRDDGRIETSDRFQLSVGAITYVLLIIGVILAC